MKEEPPKARVVGLREVEKVAVGGDFPVRIKRPGSNPDEPAFEVYDEDGLWLVYRFDTEQGRIMLDMYGDEGDTYHLACHAQDGQVAFKQGALEDQGW